MATTLLLLLGGLGLCIALVQRVALGVALGRSPPLSPRRGPGVSILKPLCGLDEGLEEILVTFTAFDYPDYEVVLGVKDHDDPAFPLATAMAIRDRRFRVVVQRTSPGLNPKVNQLVSLAQAARFDVLLVSDSNARLPADALAEVAGHFQDPRVACVAHPVSGTGHRSFGALLDNLHLASGVGAAQLAAKTLAGQDLVVGKSMALRRAALDRLGGFVRYADVLAEDYVIAQDLRRQGFELRIASTPVFNVAVSRSVASFFDRYLRWGVIHRTAVSLPVALAQGLTHPLGWLALGVLLAPATASLAGFVLGAVLKTVLDRSSAAALQCRVPFRRALPAVVVKDLLLFITWAHGFFARSVTWRGNRLRVGPRSALRRPLAPAQSGAA